MNDKLNNMFFFFFFNKFEERNMHFLTNMQIEHTTMTITQTGYGKGIMDAVASLRLYLQEKVSSLLEGIMSVQNIADSFIQMFPTTRTRE